jgi:hypothetical protein
MIKSLMRAWSVVGRQLLRNNSSGVPYILAQSGVPVGLAPNGTVATNGQITLGTALPRVYSNGIWLRLPAGAVSGGAAGLYWCVMSSTTVGQVYTNFADTSQKFTPYIPTGTLVNAVGSNSAYTQTVNIGITLINTSVPGNSMGANGSLRATHQFSCANNANNKSIQLQFGAYNIIYNAGISSSAGTQTLSTIRNCGVTNSQVANFNSLTGLGTSSNMGYYSNDTTVDQPIFVLANIGVATDYIIFEAGSLEVLPS